MIQLVYCLFRALLSNLVAQAIKQTGGEKKIKLIRKARGEKKKKEETDELECAG